MRVIRVCLNTTFALIFDVFHMKIGEVEWLCARIIL